MSLPTRERELKRRFRALLRTPKRSLPTRERELKLQNLRANDDERMSLPTRERELKPLSGARADATLGRSLHGSVN